MPGELSLALRIGFIVFDGIALVAIIPGGALGAALGLSLGLSFGLRPAAFEILAKRLLEAVVLRALAMVDHGTHSFP